MKSSVILANTILHRTWRRRTRFTKSQISFALLALVIATLTLLYLGLILQSVAKPLVKIVVVGPQVQSNSIRLAQDPWIDLSGLFSSVSAAHTLEDLRIHPNLGIEQVVSHEQLLSHLQQKQTPGTPLVIYYSGVISVASEHAASAESSWNAGIAAQTNELRPLLAALKNSDSPMALLVVDLVLPDLPGPLSLAASHCFEQARNEIDTVLQNEGRVPVSVQLSINRIPRWYELGTPSRLDSQTPMLPRRSERSQAFVDAIFHFSKSHQVEIHKLQEFLRKPILNDARPIIYQAQTEWINSPNWPMNHAYMALSPCEKKSQPIASEPSQFSTQETAPQPSDTVVNLLQDYRELLLNASKSTVDMDLSWLSIPERETFASLHGTAYSFLERMFFQLRATYELSPGCIDPSSLRTLVRSLNDALNSRPISESCPDWVTPFYANSSKQYCANVNSIIARAVLANYDLASSLEPSELQWMAHLRSYLESSDTNSKNVLLDFSKAIPERQQSFVENQWISNILSQRDLDSLIAKELIHNKLVGLRMASDPLVVMMFESSLLEANQQLVQAERILLDKTIPDWKVIGLQKLRVARGQYNLIYTDFQRNRKGLQELQAWVRKEFINLDHFSFPAPQLEPDGGSADDIEVLTRYCRIWLDFHKRLTVLASSPTFNQRLHGSWFQQTPLVRNEFVAFDFPLEASEIFRTLKESLEYVPSGDNSKRAPSLNLASEFLRTIACDELRDVRNLLSFDSKRLLEKVISFNQHRILLESNGSTTWEAELLTSQSLSWKKASEDLGQLSDQGVDRHFSNSIRIDSVSPLDLRTRNQSNTFLGLEFDQIGDSEILISTEHNDAQVQIEVDGKKIASGSSVMANVTTNRDRKFTLPISVRKLSSETSNKPVALLVSKGDQKRRAILEFDQPLPKMLAFQFRDTIDRAWDANAIMHRSDSDHHEISLFGNKQNPISISTKNLDARDMVFSHRLLLNQSESPFPVRGVLNQTNAKEILATTAGLQVAAMSVSKICKTGQLESLLFLPHPDLEKLKDTSFRELIIESTNETSGQLQYTILKSNVVRPNQFLNPTVMFYSNSQSLDVIFSSTESKRIPDVGVQARCELWELATGRMIATPQCVLGPDFGSKTIRLSVAGSQSKKFLINVIIDEWRSAFVFEIDRDRSGFYEPNTSFVGTALKATMESDVVPKGASTLDVMLDLCIDEATFDPKRDKIQIGIDHNHDRTLDGEVVVEVRDTKNVLTLFQGTGPQGELLLEPRIEPIKASIPVELEWNRKGTVLAKMIRAGETIYATGPDLIFDNLPPEIRTLQIQNSSPILLGKPLLFDAITDDLDLSEVAQVEAGWSVTGELSFHERMVIIPGISNHPNRWTISLPTDKLLPGRNTLLVRARDRAGNMSETFSLPISLISQADYEKQLTSAQTIVRGKLISAYKLLPGAELKLGTEIKPDPEKPNESKNSEPDLKIIASTTADESGTFLFNGIPSGEYIVESNVIQRGSRIIQRTPIVVKAMEGPSECSIIVGKQK